MSNGPHDYALHWHSAPGSTVELEVEDTCSIKQEGSKLRIMTASNGWKPEVKMGCFSPAYGAKQTAPIISFCKNGTKDKEVIASVLWDDTAGNVPPTLTSLCQSSYFCAYRLANESWQSIFIVGDGISTINIDGWETDAGFLYALLDSEGSPLQVILIQVAIARYQSLTIHESQEKVTYVIV